MQRVGGPGWARVGGPSGLSWAPLRLVVTGYSLSLVTVFGLPTSLLLRFVPVKAEGIGIWVTEELELEKF